MELIDNDKIKRITESNITYEYASLQLLGAIAIALNAIAKSTIKHPPICGGYSEEVV